MFEANVYKKRRKRLMQTVSSGIVLMPANNEQPMNYPGNCYHYRQDSSFLYYFGLDVPNIWGYIDVDRGETILFADELTIEDIVWMGELPSFKEQASSVGITKVKPLKELKNVIGKAQNQHRNIHFLPVYQHSLMFNLGELLSVPAEQIKTMWSKSLTQAVINMRSIKEAIEIEQIELACDLGYEMHISAFKNCAPGKLERELFGIMEGIAYMKGARPSFPTILSQNGETLHNYDHSQTLTEGRLLLVDAGAEILNHYSSDFTRTIPISGKFDSFQTDIYNTVVDAVEKGIALSKPGVKYQQVHLAVCTLIAERLKDLGLMRGNIHNAVEFGAPAMFLPCGLGHHMGLDVHDMEGLGEDMIGYDEMTKRLKQFGYNRLRMGKELKSGMVMTVEPGIYFIPGLISMWEKNRSYHEFINFEAVKKHIGFGGVRIEDDILITKNGNRLLGSKRLPTTIDEVMEAMAK